MRTSETTTDLAAALATARGEMTHAVLNKTNPHFRSRYADLASVMDATTPALSKHGLSIVQPTDFDAADRFILITRLNHKTGQWMESVYPLPFMPDKPQVMGSAITYARRYAWASIIGIAADEDDDANAVQDAGPRKSSAKAKRDGDWDRLQNDMMDAQSAVSLQRLWDGYRQREYATWSPTWRQQAEELFERRMAEFSAQDLGEVLEDSLEAELPKPDTFAPNARERAKEASEHATTEMVKKYGPAWHGEAKRQETHSEGTTDFVTPTAVQIHAYRERVTWLKGATTAAELRKRAKNLEHLTEIEKLTPGQVENLRAFYREHAALLTDKEAGTVEERQP